MTTATIDANGRASGVHAAVGSHSAVRAASELTGSAGRSTLGSAVEPAPVLVGVMVVVASIRVSAASVDGDGSQPARNAPRTIGAHVRRYTPRAAGPAPTPPARRRSTAYGADPSASPVTVACQIRGVNESLPESLRVTRAEPETPLVRAYAGFCEGLAGFLVRALVEPQIEGPLVAAHGRLALVVAAGVAGGGAGQAVVEDEQLAAAGGDVDAEVGEAGGAALGDVAEVGEGGDEALAAAGGVALTLLAGDVVGVEVGAVLLAGVVVDDLQRLGVAQREADAGGDAVGDGLHGGVDVVADPREGVAAALAEAAAGDAADLGAADLRAREGDDVLALGGAEHGVEGVDQRRVAQALAAGELARERGERLGHAGRHGSVDAGGRQADARGFRV